METNPLLETGNDDEVRQYVMNMIDWFDICCIGLAFFFFFFFLLFFHHL